MAITSASVEANGWVLRVTHTAGLGSFASYTLDPNGVPTLTLSVVSGGYVQSGGVAVAGTTTRKLIATKPLRKPVSATNAGVRAAKAIDEIDNGDGTVTVRVALSQHVYATDTGLTIAALAGWRSGQTAQTIGVTNAATLAAPQPLVRWSDVPYQLQEGSFDLEVVVASHHPNGVSPVAGVKFTITDGTTVKTAWATALSTSTKYATGGTGAGVRVYKATVDPTTATALTKGLLRCDYEAYPWVGAVRPSDVAGTRSMTALGTAGLSAAAQVPFVVAYNAAGTWITPRYAYVVADASGAATASASLVSTVAATAAATPCNSINIALESLRLHAIANTGVGTLVAANGQAAITQSVDACRIRLKTGTGAHLGVGTTSVGTGIQTLASWVVVEGDPADAAPRANVILRTPSSANGGSRATRMLFRKLGAEVGANSIVIATNVWLDDVEIRGAAGSEALVVPPFTSSNAFWLTNARWWKYGLGPVKSGSTQLPVLIRSCEVERAICAPVLLNNKRLPTAVVGTSGIINDSAGTLATGLDRIAIGNDLRYVSGANVMLFTSLANSIAPAPPLPGNAMGSAYPVVARQAFINNICESYGASFPVMLPVGENNPSVLTDTIIEGNTFTGDRLNLDYNELNMATIALNDSADSIALLNRRANNVATKCATKHDFFNDPAVQMQRMGTGSYSLATSRNKTKAVGDELTANANIYRCITAGTTATAGGPSGTASDITDGTVHWTWFAVADARQHGYRPQATSAWASTYGVGFEGNLDVQPLSVANSEFYSEFYGIGSLQMAAANLEPTTSPFTLDRSGTDVSSGQMPWLLPYNAANTGGGNYRPLTTGTGVYIAGRALTANVDRDQAGFVRSVPFAAGALQSGLVALLPSSSRHATTSGASRIGWSVLLGLAHARHATRSTQSRASWRTTVAVTGGRMAMSARATSAAWTGSLQPHRSVQTTRAASSLVTVLASVSLAPANARHAVHDAVRPIVLPAAPTPIERTLTVTGDFRLTLVGAD